MLRSVFAISVAVGLQTGAGCGYRASSSTARLTAAVPAAPAPTTPILPALRVHISDYAKQHELMRWAWWEGQLDADPALEQVALLCESEKGTRRVRRRG